MEGTPERSERGAQAVYAGLVLDWGLELQHPSATKLSEEPMNLRVKFDSVGLRAAADPNRLVIGLAHRFSRVGALSRGFLAGVPATLP